MKSILKFILYIWQLPQNIAGVLVTGLCMLFDAGTVISSDDIVLTEHFFNSAVTLGNYIIGQQDIFTIQVGKHENGHRKQSRMLGPLYLFVVGIPSILRNFFDRIFHKKWDYDKRVKWYYKGFPENWADKLGGVNRWQ